MNAIIDSLRPLKARFSEKTAFLGIVIGFAIFGFALFLPWAEVSEGLASDGGSSSGWAEGGYFALVPMIGLVLGIASVRRANQPRTMLIAVAASFILLGLNNVANRSTWHRAVHYIPDSDGAVIPAANFGSSLGVGFWIGLLALAAIATFGMAWTLHRETGVASTTAAPVAAD